MSEFGAYSGQFNETEFYRYVAVQEAHKMMELAARTDAMLAAKGLEGSRRMLIHEDSLSSGIPLSHVRFGLQPGVRGKVIEDAEALVIRVPMVPAVTAPRILSDQVARENQGLLHGVRVPTKDVVAEVVAGGKITHRFLVTPEGLRAYDNPDDLMKTPGQFENGEQFLAVIPHRGTAAAQARLEETGMSLSGFVQALTLYELLPQDGRAVASSDS